MISLTLRISFRINSVKERIFFPFRFFLGNEFPLEPLEAHADGIERISDLMGDPCREVAERREPFRQLNPILHLLHFLEMPVLIHPDQGNGGDPQDEKEEDRKGHRFLDLAEDGMDFLQGSIRCGSNPWVCL